MSNIEWTDKTWNPVIGCAKVSAGCKHCYAETMAKRIRAMDRANYLHRERPYERVLTDGGRWNGRASFLPERLAEPLSWRKPARVFVNSMSDLFHEDVTFEQVAAVFGVMAATPRHTYQVLTKRPARMLEFFEWIEKQASACTTGTGTTGHGDPRAWVLVDAAAVGGAPDARWTKHPPLHWRWPLPNAWLGVSVENQAAADERIPLLLQAPAAVRFLSCEPLLEPVDLEAAFAVYDRHGEPSGPRCNPDGSPAIGWVIGGGESDGRPPEVDWLRMLRDQCREAGVPYFNKQMGSHPLDRVDRGSDWPDGTKFSGEGSYVDASLVRIYLKDRKGGDPSEWPADLQVRQWPRVGTDADGSTAPIEHDRRFSAAGGGL